MNILIDIPINYFYVIYMLCNKLDIFAYISICDICAVYFFKYFVL